VGFVRQTSQDACNVGDEGGLALSDPESGQRIFLSISVPSHIIMKSGDFIQEMA